MNDAMKNLLGLQIAKDATKQLDAIAATNLASSTVTPPVVIDNIVTQSGNVYTFTARRTANLANAESRVISLAGSTSYPPAASAADFGGAFPTATAAFAAGSATATFAVTSASAIPE